MSFLSMAFLAALPLAAAPILLHLFDRRRSVVVRWGAMQFLLEAATHRTSARKFQHWLLLLLRVVALTSLVLALARPLVPAHWVGGGYRRETILVIDNSLSTQQRTPDGTVFEQLIARAEQTIHQLPAASSVRILVSAPYPAWVTPAAQQVNSATRTELGELLHSLRPTQATSDLPAALLKAVQSDDDDLRLTGRQIILLTDGQRQDWRTGDREGWARLGQAFADAVVPATLEIVESLANPATTPNVAVVRLRSVRTVVGVNERLTIAAEVRNFSDRPSTACSVNWLIDAQHQQNVQLPTLQPGEMHELVLNHSFAKPGVYWVECRLDLDDPLAADNRGALVVEAVQQVPVLLIEGSDGLAEMQQDAYLVRAALGQIEGDNQGAWQSVFQPRSVAPQQLEALNLQDFKCVVVPNLTELSDKAVERLEQYVADGGGLWLALGPRTDIERFNNRVAGDGARLSPVGIARVVEETADDLLKPTINPFPKSHPATAGLADNERLDTGDVKVGRHWRFQMPTDSSDVSVLLELSNGEPLAVERRLGSGRIIVQAIPLRYQWSNLATSQAFVVMVNDWLAYLTEPGATRRNLEPGEPITAQIADTDHTHATLTTPDGQDIALSGEPTAIGVVFRTSRTALPGEYRLETGLADSALPFHVARDAEESDLTRLTADDRRILEQTAGVTGNRLATLAAGTKVRAPLWPVLLVVLIMVMAGDLVLSGLIARRRFGSAPIAVTAVQPASTVAIPVGMALGRRGPAAASSLPEEVHV